MSNLPQFSLGSAWQQQVPVPEFNRDHPEFVEEIIVATGQLVSAYDQYGPGRYHIPPPSFRIPSSMARSQLWRFECVSGLAVYLPCTEITRHWYVRTNQLAALLFDNSFEEAWSKVIGGRLEEDKRYRVIRIAPGYSGTATKLFALATASQDYRRGMRSVGRPLLIDFAKGNREAQLGTEIPFSNGQIAIKFRGIELLRGDPNERAALALRIQSAPIVNDSIDMPACEVQRPRKGISGPAPPDGPKPPADDNKPTGPRPNIEIDDDEPPNLHLGGARISSDIGSLTDFPEMITTPTPDPRPPTVKTPGGSKPDTPDEPDSPDLPILTPGSGREGKLSGHVRPVNTADPGARRTALAGGVKSLASILAKLVKNYDCEDPYCVAFGPGSTIEVEDCPPGWYVTELKTDEPRISRAELRWLYEGENLRHAVAATISYMDIDILLVELEGQTVKGGKVNGYTMLMATPEYPKPLGEKPDLSKLAKIAIKNKGRWPKKIKGWHVTKFKHTWPTTADAAQRVAKQAQQWQIDITSSTLESDEASAC